jgi:hypothetical protein
MVKPKTFVSSRQALLDISQMPALARLPPSITVDRRNLAVRHALLCRIHCEFVEMPGLSLTLHQATRMFGLSSDVTSRILKRLADAQLLKQTRDGQFILRTDDV